MSPLLGASPTPVFASTSSSQRAGSAPAVAKSVTTRKTTPHDFADWQDPRFAFETPHHKISTTMNQKCHVVSLVKDWMEGRGQAGDLGPLLDAVGGVVVEGDVHDGAEVVPGSVEG